MPSAPLKFFTPPTLEECEELEFERMRMQLEAEHKEEIRNILRGIMEQMWLMLESVRADVAEFQIPLDKVRLLLEPTDGKIKNHAQVAEEKLHKWFSLFSERVETLEVLVEEKIEGEMTVDDVIYLRDKFNSMYKEVTDGFREWKTNEAAKIVGMCLSSNSFKLQMVSWFNKHGQLLCKTQLMKCCFF